MTDHISKPAPVPSTSHALAERIKELNCLYGISNLFENQDVSLPWIMRRAVELIPAAWQYPENACARIRIDADEYTSRNFRETLWCQASTFVLNGNEIGPDFLSTFQKTDQFIKAHKQSVGGCPDPDDRRG